MILKQSKNFIVLFEKRKSDAHDDAPNYSENISRLSGPYLTILFV